MSSIDKVTEYEKGTILIIIARIEEDIRANGIPEKDRASLWARLGHFYGRMGDSLQQRFACKQALDIDPKNSWARTQLAKMNS